MSREYCPKCQAIQNMIISNTDIVEKDDDGNDVKVTITSYQCSICNMFIRNEENPDKYLTEINSK